MKFSHTYIHEQITSTFALYIGIAEDSRTVSTALNKFGIKYSIYFMRPMGLQSTHFEYKISNIRDRTYVLPQRAKNPHSMEIWALEDVRTDSIKSMQERRKERRND